MSELADRDEIGRVFLRMRQGKLHSGTRNQALFALMWRCGLRCGEVMSLRNEDVDVRKGLLLAGRNRRIIPMDRETRELLHQWEVFRDRTHLECAFYFCSRKGKPLGAGYIRSMIRDAARKIGVSPAPTTLELRRACLLEMEDEGFTASEIFLMFGPLVDIVRAARPIELRDLREKTWNRVPWIARAEIIAAAVAASTALKEGRSPGPDDVAEIFEPVVKHEKLPALEVPKHPQTPDEMIDFLMANRQRVTTFDTEITEGQCGLL